MDDTKNLEFIIERLKEQIKLVDSFIEYVEWLKEKKFGNQSVNKSLSEFLTEQRAFLYEARHKAKEKLLTSYQTKQVNEMTDYIYEQIKRLTTERNKQWTPLIRKVYKQ